MNPEDGVVKGCARCARFVAGISMAKADLANLAHKLSHARTDLSRAALTGALPKAKFEVMDSRALLADHLSREHA